MKDKNQSLWDEIQSMPNDPQYKEVPNFPIPLGKGVVVKKVKQDILQLGGIIIPDANSENSQSPHLGVIFAVGPLCTQGVRVGLRCYYNFYANLEVRIAGETYVLMDEHDVYYILRSTQHQVIEGDGIKPAKEVRRAKKINETDNYYARKHKVDQNEKDKKHDKTKGKIFAITKK